MKLLPLLLLLGATPPVTFTSTQSLSQAEPTLSTQGFALARVNAVRITLCAAAGQTLSGAGTLRARYLSPAAGTRWAKGAGRDLAVPAAAAGVSCWTFDDLDVTVHAGRGLWIADAVTVSSGSTVILYFDLGVL